MPVVFFWFVDSLVLMEFYQRLLGLWLWSVSHAIIQKGIRHLVLVFILVQEGEFGKCLKSASLSYRYLGFFTSVDRESSFFRVSRVQVSL